MRSMRFLLLAINIYIWYTSSSMIILCIACYTGVAVTKNARKQIYHGSSVLTEKKNCFLGEIFDSKRIIEPGDVAFTPHPLLTLMLASKVNSMLAKQLCCIQMLRYRSYGKCFKPDLCSMEKDQ